MRGRDACITSAVLGIGALCSSEVDAAKEWTPQEVAAILAQSYAQVLMRSLGTEPGSLQPNEADQQRYMVQSGYA
ncbi:exported protein of unknown function [Nitrospira defluvii]|jgi:hypothetical protein|uniref:Exported protein n=1 Tax=Nitrospira defluvii TaxID=330214 RepID=B3U4N8_9BACT|nr:exported protein [Nitrospira defluvii]CBK41198.1 exported protein of unknown function [Nitrospira defluvii]